MSVVAEALRKDSIGSSQKGNEVRGLSIDRPKLKSVDERSRSHLPESGLGQPYITRKVQPARRALRCPTFTTAAEVSALQR